MYIITFFDLLYIALPLFVVYYIYQKWNDDKTTIPYALSRMFIQLVLIGYILTYIFETKNFYIVISILFIMLIVASIISMRPVAKKDKKLYLYSFISIFIGGVITLGFVIVGVLDLPLWYEPRQSPRHTNRKKQYCIYYKILKYPQRIYFHNLRNVMNTGDPVQIAQATEDARKMDGVKSLNVAKSKGLIEMYSPTSTYTSDNDILRAFQTKQIE